jgi:hypothetical protein
MKTPLTAVGIVLIAIGGVWFLQGIGVLPGSFMTGQTRWAVIGAIAAVVGLAMLGLARRS